MTDRKARHTLQLRTGSLAMLLRDCVEGGVVGGLQKARKWELVTPLEDVVESRVSEIVSGYVMANIEELFDLEGDE